MTLDFSTFTLDLSYSAVVILADVLRLAAAAFIATSILYSLVMVTIFVIRNERG